MGDPSIMEDIGERSLYCITNSKNKNYANDLYQVDLPKIILEGANIVHNLKFLSDYVSGDKDEYIRGNGRALTEINIIGILNKSE